MATGSTRTGPMPISKIIQMTSVPPALKSHVTNPDFERYERLGKLGEGTYGVVYKAIDRLENKYVAMKKVTMDAWEDGVPATALREISVLKEISHENVVALQEVFVSFSGNLYLVFELLDGDLKHVLDSVREKGLPGAVIKSYMYQILRGIDACHSHRVIHRDLKPQNILVDSKGCLKLADFGLARTFALPLRAYTHEIITLWYRCPEVLLGLDVYSPAVDIWGAGCIFGEMVTGKPMFTGDSEIDQLFRTFRKLGTPSAEEWPLFPTLPDYKEEFPKFKPKEWTTLLPGLEPAGIDLISKMLVYDPTKRISAAEALEHPYFADVELPAPPTPIAAAAAKQAIPS